MTDILWLFSPLVPLLFIGLVFRAVVWVADRKRRRAQS